MDIELKLLDLLQNIHNPIFDKIMIFITRLGDVGLIWIVLTIILLILPKTRKAGVILTVAICIDTILCNGILKPLFARIRPFDVNTSVQLLIPKPKDFSFPSGHTAISFAVTTALYFCNIANKRKLFKPAIFLSILIAFSRMYLYVHYPSDILGGAIIGAISGFLGYYAVKYISNFLSNSSFKIK